MLARQSAPIGIFDSGIGGLTIAQAIHRLMPNESLVFFGDTAHLPYGDKSHAAIKHFAEQIYKYLKQKEAKAIVIACNSASAAAYDYLHFKYGQQPILLSVIDPVISWIIQQEGVKKVGIVGTKATIESNAYALKLALAAPNMQCVSLATPLLAPMVEEGFINDNISELIVKNYLNHSSLQNIDVLVLACTHYPLIKNVFQRLLPPHVKIVDSTTPLALTLKDKLASRNLLLEKTKKQPIHHFYVSDLTPSFEKTTQLFFGKSLTLEQVPIWKEELKL